MTSNLIFSLLVDVEYDLDAPADDQEENAADVRAILEGHSGPKRNIVVLNAAAGIYVAGLADSYLGAFELAEASIDEGKALAKLNWLVEHSNS